MRKAMDVIGLPILSLESGAELGKVRDILCDQQWRVLGFLVTEETWFQAGTYVPLDMLYAVGDDCLTVRSDAAAAPLHNLAAKDMIAFLTGPNRLKGKAVLTTSGELMGKVEDVYFLPDWEKLIGYELSNGWIADVKEGRRRLHATPSVVIGKQHLIVPDSNRVLA
ncbi:PRC-barrel domain-containing protein [Brevibacillus migulae]|uniref:PRC-barrel domain-containing protein n=1 Tax=Brevibacillus migulae TaxID=1644114 RepID=UPI00106E3CA7|nr:PRC-barrel domain-containing protein [Brevibacillus migulae]